MQDSSLSAGTPAARRLVRPSWRDRRLVVGVVLVLGSTVLGARLLGTGDSGTPVWTARHDLAAGMTLRAEDLEVRRVDLAAAGARYLDASVAVPSGAFMNRAVGVGELVPAEAVTGTRETSAARVVTIPVGRFHAAEDLARGDVVDVYVTLSDDDSQSGSPLRVASAVHVVDIEGAGGRFGGGSERGVAVSVPEADVPKVVGGITRGTVDVVRVPRGMP